MDASATLSDIADGLAGLGVPVLLVGGWALNSYGVSRQTIDIDLLIREPDFGEIDPLLRDQGYRMVYRGELFARYQCGRSERPDIGVLFASPETVDAMIETAQSVKLAGVELAVPSLEHLMGMKLHALKHNYQARAPRDIPDLVALIQANREAVTDEDFRDLCEKYGTPKICRQVETFLEP